MVLHKVLMATIKMNVKKIYDRLYRQLLTRPDKYFVVLEDMLKTC